MTEPATFALDGVTAGPPHAPILTGMSVRIPCRGITAVAGPSGSGKTTLLRLLNRLDDPLDGRITLDGEDVRHIAPSELRRRVAMIFQRPPMFPGTVMDNLRVALPSLTDAAGGAVLERVGLTPGMLDQPADQLSGGEAQRVCVARALLTDPAVILADEPTAALDGAARRKLEDLGVAIARDGVAIVWVTHDTDQLRRIADHVVVLVGGRVAAFGHLDELDAHGDPLVRELIGAPA